MSVAKEILALVPQSPLRLVPVTCVATAPFQVSISGTSAWVPARKLAGSTFGVGDQGMALWQPPLPPICFTTT